MYIYRLSYEQNVQTSRLKRNRGLDTQNSFKTNFNLIVSVDQLLSRVDQYR